MENVEQRALDTFAYPQKVRMRYMDDTFRVTGMDLIDIFFQHLNSTESCVQFTVERVEWSATCFGE